MAGNSTMTEDYLKSLYSAEERSEDGVGVTELARRMGVVASTASENVRKLHRDGLVEHAPYQKVHLTDKGREAAISIVRRHRILETYLYEKLGFDWDEVHREAEILEHAVSEALLGRMNEVLGFPIRDPHGDPIPQVGSNSHGPSLKPLADVEVGFPVVVARISDSEPALLRHLDSLGVVLDAKVTLIERLDYAGIVKAEVVPPKGWNPKKKLPGSSPAAGQPETCDLGDVAVEAIWVLD